MGYIIKVTAKRCKSLFSSFIVDIHISIVIDIYKFYKYIIRKSK